ncbi:unnamed protein product [Parascedosporium putredinis]|uniref:Catalase n=1 Tax=Parascedosporium putredinis TaxID=1442378 RepID=A0A9P1GX45_9PEZI|nr:unnamed protein product [Parascedosporium putredinis]CAI7988686.1 unnamed protein product [Parascedosporium putredinis]
MASLALGQCPFANNNKLRTRQEGSESDGSRAHVQGNDVVDGDVYMTSDVGGPFTDQRSLRVGDRGPTLLEDFVFRQKITHFDHERVPERAVHARGAGAYGKFVSYGDFSNITAASFLNTEGKETPVFVRFSTVLGSRGSPDTVRDVHGFATRFYTDEGNWDLVGNNIPVFFIQDAIQFPDLIHAGKPKPDREIPQAGTAHDSAWDFFSQQTTSLHTLFFAMSGFGIPAVTGTWTASASTPTASSPTRASQARKVPLEDSPGQGRAPVGRGPGRRRHGHRLPPRGPLAKHRRRQRPEWELAVQLIDEDKAQAYGFDVLDPTKIVPEEIAPLKKLGKMTLDTNPRNYFAETEQIMFQPGHIVRGIDFSEDPLLQGRIFSYLDTQINRHGGPNFEQIPINRPIVPVHNNNRDGAAQMMIHRNPIHYTPNSLNSDKPMQANKTHGRGFFTTPGRHAEGPYVRTDPDSFADHWSQPRLFYNSLTPAEKQQVIDGMRFETSKIQSDTVKKNVLQQLNKVSNDVAARVAVALGLEIPAPDPTYYHDNTTAGFNFLKDPLPTIAGLKVGVLASVDAARSLSQAAELKSKLDGEGVTVIVVAERMAEGVDATYTSIRSNAFDGLVVAEGAEKLFNRKVPVAAIGSASAAFENSLVEDGPGVYKHNDTSSVVDSLKEGLKTFKLTAARILTYGYDAYGAKLSVVSSNRLIDHATNLLNDLTTERSSAGAASRPLIFVAHSLGGLVCKEAILLSRNHPEAHLRGIFDSVRGVIFMGTPHKGSWMADWAKIPISALGLVKSTNGFLLDVLKSDNQYLESLQVRFWSMTRELREAGRAFEVTCFFEELPMSVVGEVVSKESATLEGYSSFSIHANHSDMVRFASAEENGFKRLVGELTRPVGASFNNYGTGSQFTNINGAQYNNTGIWAL